MDNTHIPKKFELPTIFVIFGITGDLAKKKIIKAIYNLHLKKLLPQKFQVYGFSRRDLNDETLKEYLRDIMTKGDFKHPKEFDNFLSVFHYIKGDFDEKKSYDDLAKVLGRIDGQWSICSNKLFYLAVPPLNYRTILENLHNSGLTIPCSPEEGWTRVILEKPFGTDLQTAKELDTLLGQLFKEEQIYRVDHYLAKETVRNILAFRFSNSFFAPAWNNKYIEKVEVRLLEKETVATRGDFYDKVGALRDVGQNHMLQMLALFTMGNPGTFTPENIRAERARALANLKILDEDKVEQYTVRGQYNGYRQVKGVDPHSDTETYFKIKAYSNKPSFQNIPLYIESGKAMSSSKIEVIITFKHHTPCLCPPNQHYQNALYYQIKPHEKIITKFLVKKPGYEYELSQQDFEFDYKQVYKDSDFIEDYEQLLMDIIRGDQTLFVTTEEIFSEWKFVEPIIKAWEKDTPPLITYEPHSHLNLNVLDDINEFKKEIAIVGLGKMGAGLALQLVEKGWKVSAFNRSREKTDQLAKQGIIPKYTLKELVESQSITPRIVWLMVPAGATVDDIIFGPEGVASYLNKGDIVVDGGNSNYKDSIRRGKKLAEMGIKFVDVGVSGGPAGARTGACIMIGGERELYEYLKPLYRDISIADGYRHFDGFGAGHFVKMVHNGIEYGMMQAIAEGFAIMKKADFNLDLNKVAQIYNNGSVIEARLVGWLQKAYVEYGQDLEEISGTIGHTGEGAWTVDAATELGIEVPVIKDSLQFRIDSTNNPSYTGQVVSALRNQFGGHAVKKIDK